MSTFFMDNVWFRVKKMAANKSRVAKAICNDKLRGGSENHILILPLLRNMNDTYMNEPYSNDATTF